MLPTLEPVATTAVLSSAQAFDVMGINEATARKHWLDVVSLSGL